MFRERFLRSLKLFPVAKVLTFLSALYQKKIYETE